MSGKKSGHYWFSCRVVTVWLQGSFWLTKPEGKDPGRDCVDLNFSELATVLVAQCGKSRKMSDLFQKSIWRIFHAIKLRKIIDDFEYWFFWTQIVGLVTVCLKGEIVVISLLRSSREIFAKFRGMLVVV